MSDVEDLIREHRPLALRLAARWARCVPRHVPAEDLEAAALVGLWRAARRFDPARRTRFGTFARPRIAGEIRDWLRLHGGQRRGAPPRPRHESLERFVADGRRALRLADALADPRQAPPDAGPARGDFDALTRALPGRARLVLWRYYGEGRLMREIGAELGLSESRVSGMLAEARAELAGVLR